jgi:superfamily II DNA/RNA helicase
MTDNVDYVVIDECDSLMEEHESRWKIHDLMAKFKPQRQLFMFSATLNLITKQECIKLMKN